MEPASGSSDIRSELARLQERETLLTHLLQLERERRVQAEQLVEVELQACLKLSQQLERERRVTACNEREGVCSTEDSDISQPLRSDGVSTGAGEVNGIKEVSADGEDNTSLLRSPQNHLNPNPIDHCPDTSLLLPLLDNSFDFSSSVFSQLTSDLQQILGIGKSSDSTAQPSVADALEAVKANDPQKLQDCITSLQLDNDEGKSLLELASEHGYTGCVRVLLKGGCGLSSSQTDGKTPVHLVAENGHLDSLNLLLNSGADPSVQDTDGQTPLFLALKQSKTNCVDRLLHVGTGSLLQPTTKCGLNLLHAAVFGNVPSSLRSLLTHLRISLESSKVTQMINHADRDGRTPLHIASSRGQTECVHVLCACEELDITRRDRWNRTPLDIATTECRELLLSRESKQAIVRIKIPDSSIHVSYHGDGPSSKGSVAIGRITVLRQHKLSDVEILVHQALEQYCKILRGYSHSSTTSNHLSVDSSEEKSSTHLQPARLLAERILREYEFSKQLVQPSCMSEQDRDDSIETYREKCEQILRENFVKTESLDLSESSVSSYQVGSYEWKAGRLEKGVRMKSLFSVFGEMGGKTGNDGSGSEIPEVFVTLKDADQGCLDQLVFELMIPIAKLKKYVQLIEQHKTLMIHGAQGSGKTHLTTSLAEYLKHKHGVEDTQVVHVSLHPSFQRDDLFRIFHLNGLLIPLEEEGGSNRQTVAHSLRLRTHVIILDDLSHVSVPSVLAELLTSLSYRTPSHPMWVSNVYDREGTLLYPCGLYYLKEGSYFIATKTVASGEPLEAVTFDQFAHISLGLRTEPTSGILRRQLMMSLIDSRQGDPPHSSDPFYRLIQWLVEVWLLYNSFMLRMDLPELTAGLRHFLHFPLQSNDFISWVCSIWNHHLAPSIESSLSTYPDLVSSTGTQIHRQAIISKMLVACSRMVFGLTCPLEHEAKLKMMDQLMSRLEGTVGSDGSPRAQHGGKTLNEPIANGRSLSTVAPPTNSTPPPVVKTSLPSRHSRSQSEKPRKMTSAKPPPAPKAGNMVSYEDMIRNSPRSQVRKNKNSKKESATKYATLQTDKPPSSPIPGVTLRQGAGKNKTLRRLRSKTISLFSKDGTSTLPKLFRRGSRTSLVSLSEEDPVIKPPTKQSPIRKSQPPPSHKSDQLNDLFDMLSTSNRIDDQRSPPPHQVSISPSPSSASNSSLPRQTSKGVGDLDDLLNLLDTMGSSRIDDQRSPPLDEIQDETEESRRVIPKYVIPTSSPKGEKRNRRKGRVSALKGITTSPPTSSMPDLTVAEQPNVQHVREHSDGSVFRYKTEVQTHHGGTRYGRHSISGVLENSQYQNSVDQNGYHTSNNPDHVRDRAHSYHMYDYSAPSTEPLHHRSVSGYRTANSAKSSPGMSYRPLTSPLAMTSYTTTISRDPSSPNENSSSAVMGTKQVSVDSGSLGGFCHSHQHQYSNADNSSVDLERVNHVSPSQQLDNRNDLQHHNVYDSYFTNSSRRWSGDRIRARSASNLLDDVEEMNDIGDFDLFRASSEGDILQSPTARDQDYADYEGEKRTDTYTQVESGYQQSDYVNFDANGHSGSFTSVHTPTSSYVTCDQHHGEPDSAYKSSLEDSYHSYTLPSMQYYNGNTPNMNGYTEDSSYPRERSNSVSMPARRYSLSHELKRKVSETKLSSPVKTNNVSGNRRTSDTGSVFSASLAFSASLGFLSPDSSLVKHSMSRDKLSDYNVDHAEM